ncbi:DUF4276 family protein [Draconibacterium sp. IB214405]|uniref:DUF4276 family protein n=1 Tax=Draconibacterium sp. IB214405 TaxID=3097352 RepID=UPI002A1322DC|nr:DUF4276 family protein [Draconibacterium sp. IB214405]MDX8340545.1 DUF4276 family protein [Draconibacterium sp. IB214405]
MSSGIKRIIIICEGPTEREFCKDVLVPYFAPKNIFIEYPLIKKSGGGIVPWKSLKDQIITHFKQDGSAIVSTLIDYYGIPGDYDYPDWDEAHQETDKSRRMEHLEQGMLQAIPDIYRNRFLPYIQLHEFEGILFSELRPFLHNFLEEEFVDYPVFEAIFNCQNPEEINRGRKTAPSKRLLRHIVGYNKVVYGATLAEEIGLAKIRERCPRFNEWINKIENI